MVKFFIKHIILLCLVTSASYAQKLTHSGTFNHIGAIESTEELAFVKDKIANNEEPWSSAINDLMSWTGPGVLGNVGTGENGPRDLCKTAYANALAWHYTGNTLYADYAVDILNAWSNFTGYNVQPASQSLLVGGWIGSLLGPTAELMREYPGWTSAEQAALKTMFTNSFYPVVDLMSTWNGNVDLTQIEAMLAIATFNEDVDEFNKGLLRLELRNPAYYYLSTDPAASRNYGGSSEASWGSGSTVTLWVNGLTQETCRDNGHHAQFAMAATLAAAEIAWHQGVDVYTAEQERYVAVLELMAKQLETGNMQGTCADNVTNGDRYNTFEIGYNHYHNRMGIDMPATESYLATGVSRNAESSWNIFYETLTHADLQVVVSNNPKLLTATLASDGVTLTAIFSNDLTTVNTNEVNNFSLLVNGVSTPLAGLTHSVTATTLEFTLTNPLIYSDVVKLEYAGGTITSTDTEILEAFTNKTVTNLVEAPTMLIATADNGNLTNFHTAWFAFNDAGNNGASVTSPVADEYFFMSADGANGTDSTAAITYTLDKGTYLYDPFVGMGFNLSLVEGEAFNLTGTTGISFFHKGPPCTITVGMTTVVDYCTYSYTVTEDATWTQHSINWNQFTQPGWGTQVAFDVAEITAFQWQINGITGDASVLEIDEVALTGEPIKFPTYKVNLVNAIDSAIVLEANAIIGYNIGEYPTSAANAFNTAITSATSVNTNENATQTEIDNATSDLLNAITIFLASEITSTILSQTIKLTEGWNLISFNVLPADNLISSVFNGINYSMIKNADAFNSINNPEYANNLKKIVVGEGYLVHVNQDEILIVNGNISTATIDPTSLKTGWNLIGATKQTDELISNYFNNTNSTQIKSFDGFWEPNGTLNSITNFETGKAYFINVQ